MGANPYTALLFRLSKDRGFCCDAEVTVDISHKKNIPSDWLKKGQQRTNSAVPLDHLVSSMV